MESAGQWRLSVWGMEDRRERAPLCPLGPGVGDEGGVGRAGGWRGESSKWGGAQPRRVVKLYGQASVVKNP